MNFGGLSAVYPGYQAAEKTDLGNEQSRLANEEAVRKALASEILGRAFGAGGGQPQGPQPPAPGQPSMPAQPPPQAVPMPQPRPEAVGGPGGPRPAAMPPQAAAPGPQAGPQMGEISLQALTQRILQTTPQVQNHPELLLAALERAAPILDRQSREDLGELRKQMATERLAQAGQLAQARIDAARAAEEGRNTRAEGRNARTDRRLDQADTREARLSAASMVRQDQRWQQLEVQKQEAARRAQEGGDKAALSKWRAIVDAQHKRATEIIGANSLNSNLKEADKKDLLAEQNAFYRDEIANMRNGSRPAAPQTAGQPPAPGAPAPAAQAPAPGAPSPAPAASAPPLAMLKQGVVTTFANGQRWTIGADGQPKQVQ